MKKINLMIIATVCTFMGSSVLNAQGTIYDATRLIGSDLNGTARFIGMGGAMGALGGDITTMGINPAGIGIYRSSDVMMSFGLGYLGMESTYQNQNNNFNKTFGSFDNAGAVFAYKMGNQTPLRFVNFGFNYRRLKSFDRNTTVAGHYVASQTEQISDMTNASGASLEELTVNGAYSNQNLPWLGILGHDSYLINPWYDKDDKLGGYNSIFRKESDEVDGIYNSRERGSLNSFDFNIALNFYDRFYLGATIGAYYLDYTRNSTYTENFFYLNSEKKEWLTNGGYDLNSYYAMTGSGVDFKLGFILRPFESLPLRIGASIHTPTFYRITEFGSASVDYDVDLWNAETESYDRKNGHTFTQDRYGDEWRSESRYQVVTPWKYNLSLGYTIGKAVALGVEYEYSDYSAVKMYYEDGVAMVDENLDAKNMLNGVRTVRVGGEFKVTPQVAFRLGYNHTTATMKDDARKFLSNNSVRTDTEYANLKSANNYTAGLGYRGTTFYADLAYQYNTNRENFYAFNSLYLDETKVKYNNHRVVVTLGMRF